MGENLAINENPYKNLELIISKDDQSTKSLPTWGGLEGLKTILYKFHSNTSIPNTLQANSKTFLQSPG